MHMHMHMHMHNMHMHMHMHMSHARVLPCAMCMCHVHVSRVLHLRRETTRDLEERRGSAEGAPKERLTRRPSGGLAAGLFERAGERNRDNVLSPGPLSGSISSRRTATNPYDPASFAMSRQATQRLSTAHIGMPTSPASPASSTSPPSPSIAPSRRVVRLRRSADGLSPIAAGRELRAQSRTISRGERRSRTVRFRTESRESVAPPPLSATHMGKTGRVKL